jgi:hypothetical protein
MFRRYAIVAQNDVRTALRLTQEYSASEMTKDVAAVVNWQQHEKCLHATSRRLRFSS